jgi:hypothetical protein
MPVTVDALAVDLRAGVRARVAGADVIDEQSIAADLIVGWSPEEMRQALMLTLPRFVGDVIRLDRASVMTRPAMESPATVAAPPAPSRRWEAAAATHAAGLLDTPIRTANGHRRLGECDLADVQFAHDRCAEVADRNAMQAARYARLRDRMVASGAETVADLGEAETVEIFHG